MRTPVSYHQERLWFIDRFEKGNLYESSPVYHNIPLIIKIGGPLEIELLERAVARVIDRHEALRTRVITADQGPEQWIDPQVVFKLEVLDLSTQGREIQEEELLNLALEEVRRPFSIEKDLLTRGKLYKKKDGEFLLVLVLHHITADGYSLDILVQEMFRFYHGIRSGQEPQLPELTLHYADFARWQRDFSPRTLKPLQIYWKRKLRGKLPPLELPTDRPRALVHIFKPGRKNFSFPKTIRMITGDLARQTGSSPMVVLLAAFKVLLHRYSGLEEIIVGTSVENRTQPETRGMIGPLANLVVLRSYLSEEITFSGFISQLRETVDDAFRYGAMPFDRLVTELDPQKDMSRTALFDVLFQYREQSARLEVPAGLTIDIIETNLGWGKYDLNVLVEDKGETLSGVVVYNAKYYDEWRISRMIDHFINIAGEAAANPDRPLKSLDMLGRQEKYQLLEEWSGAAAKMNFPRAQTIHGLFEEQAQKTPDQTALVEESFGQVLNAFGGTTAPGDGADHPARPVLPVRPVRPIQLTYHELNERSNRLAGLLIEKGVRPDTIVGIMAERSVEMITGILGILKAGGAYLPIDPEYPQDRINYMIKDSGANILVSDHLPPAAKNLFTNTFQKLAKKTSFYLNPDVFTNSDAKSLMGWGRRPLFEKRFPDFQKLFINPPKETRSINNYQLTINNLQLEQTNLAYIIYTSGSTGRPKGVPVTHRNVVRLLVNDEFQFDFGPRDVWTMFHSPCFDFSVWEMYGALLLGGKLVLIPRAAARDTQRYLLMLKDHQVTVSNQTPSAFYALMNEEIRTGAKELNLRYVIFGGEALAPGKIKPWQARYPRTRLINMYGITETTVHVTFKEITGKEIRENLCSIGKPIPTLFVYVLDSLMQPAAVGAPGELCVGGEGLARGYLNQPGLTAEKFVKNPHKHGSRLYRSGDLVRFLNNGEMEYLGRIDSQVQLRGFRVEPGEIENRLTACPWVKEVVVHVWEDDAGEKYLCAYFTPGGSARDNGIGRKELREYLKQTLPDYMIPAYFIPLEKIPLTVNGKIDRKALPAPAIEREKDYAAPRDDIEKKLADIWCDILGVEKDKISIDADFFHLGGHSLKVTVLASRVHKEFDINLPLSEIFMTPHIRGLAAYIKEAAGSKYIPVQPVEKKEYYPLSSAQRRLYILQQMDAEKGTAYNMPALWQVEGDLKKEKFEAIFHRLIRRHESLRTSFYMVKGEPVQVIHDEAEFNLTTDYTDYADVKEDTATIEGQSKAFAGVQGAVFSKRAPWPPEAFIRPFDLSKAPLLRAGLIALPHTPSALRVPPSQEGKSDRYLLMVDMHHIISDGTSINIVMKDFMALYNQRDLPGLRIRYKDFSEWQRSDQHKEKLKQQEIFWLKEFSDEIPVLDLPTDYARPVVQEFSGQVLDFEIDAGETQLLKSLCREQGVTLFMALLSLYNILLSRLSGRDDIVIGSPVAGRRHADLEGIIGMFVNTLALRNYPVGEKTFVEFLHEVKEKTLRAFENQEYQYEDLLERAAVERDAGRNPLFDTLFVLQNIDTTELDIPGLKLSPYSYGTKISKFDLSLIGMEEEKRLCCAFEYSTHLFTEATIARFITYFKKIISGVLSESRKDIKLSEIEIISPEEKKQIIFDFNDTETVYPKDKTLHRLFTEQVEKAPDHIALHGCIGQNYKLQNTNYKQSGAPRGRGASPIKVLNAFGEGVAPGDGVEIPVRPVLPVRPVRPVQLTYRELNERSDGLAGLLIEKGVRSDTIVGIMVERSVEIILGIMGILKAGGAYLPIDPDYPEERVNYMLTDSAAKVLLSEEHRFNCQLPIVNCQLLMSASEGTGQNNSTRTGQCPVPTHSLAAGHRPPATTLAYVIYTSGSTGRPKGVGIEHFQVVNFLFHMYTQYEREVDFNDRCLGITNIAFDVSVWEFFLPLSFGARLILLPEEKRNDIFELGEALLREGITMIYLPPALLKEVNRQLGKQQSRVRLNKMLVGVEPIRDEVLEAYMRLNPGMKIINGYGPTETTICATSYYYTPNRLKGEIVPIGVPLSNNRVFLLDMAGRVVPRGIPGEIYISGDGVSRGYINNPELTAEKFCLRRPGNLFEKRFPGPSKNFLSFHRTLNTQHLTLYRTGDIAKWLPDGNILFIGRQDHQVKIRGYRIELGEIRNRLLQHEEIEDAVVLAKKTAKIGSPGGGNENQYRLHAYIVSARIFTVSELREFLSIELPDYMIPSHFTQVEKIPLTPNGKVDRKVLETYAVDVGTGVEYIAPTNSFEEAIANIWSEELNIDKISIYDNFFELGGNSLNIIRISNRLKEVTGKTIPVVNLFRYPTIHSLSQFVGREETGVSFSNERIEESVRMMEDTALMFLEEDDE